MIDSHCHLTDSRLASQLDGVLSRAKAAGVERMITIGTSIDDARQAIALCRNHSHIRCAVGIHPNYSQDAQTDDLQTLRTLLADPVVIAAGEMGLDNHHKFASRQVQIRFFEPQLQLALELNKPIVIHSREATDDTLAVMKQFPGIRAVFHCFTGSSDEARKILDAGFYLGFTGAVTFKNAQPLREAAALVPLDRMLIETDAPYLTPEPMRKQKTNEPSMVVYVAEMLATIKNVSRSEIDQITTRNVEQLFGWR